MSKEPRFGIGWWEMNKHIFVLPQSQPMPELAPNWIGFFCKFCHKVSGLDAWQIRDMPNDMAKCEKSNVRAGFWEKLNQSVNCFGK